MSLLFEQAIAAVNLDDAALYGAEPRELEPARDVSLPVDGILEFAAHHDRLSHPEKDDWIVLPLHEVDSAALTGSYIAYTENPVHGEVFIHQQNGSPSPIDTETFAVSRLANRIRFWHSDFSPETEPSYFDSPIDERESPRNPLTDEEAEAFFDELTAFVNAEKESQRAANQAATAGLSPEEVLAGGGGAIPSLESLGNPGHQVYRFKIELGDERDPPDDPWGFVRDEFNLYEGNEIRLYPPSAEHSPDAFPLPGRVVSIDGLKLKLAFDWDRIDPETIVQTFLGKRRVGYSLVRELNPIPYDRELEAIRQLRDDTPKHELLTGQAPLTFGDPAGVKSSRQDDDLNQEQALAARCALLADQFFCIHGPPGTGKTRTLVEVVRRSVEAGEDVLVCADSNQAIDNLVVGSSTSSDPDDGSLHAYAQAHAGEFVLHRINARHSSNPMVADLYSTTDAHPDVVVATNSSAARLDREFDVLVLDEATQSTCTASCIPLAKADKLILAGDHRQLPPFSSTEEPPDTAAGMSLFEHLYAEGGVFEGVGIQLRTQYRMHADIARFPNRRFYDRSLRQGRSIDPVTAHPPLLGYNVGGSEQSVDHSYRNDTEAAFVAHLVDTLLGDPALEPDDIGVISPYSAQVNAIRTELRSAVEAGEELTVDTIDSFQGSERAAIVISLVRSNERGSIGFLGRPVDGPRRLNVALTRAKRVCAIVGDFYTLTDEAAGADKDTSLYTDLRDFLVDTGRMNEVPEGLFTSTR